MKPRLAIFALCAALLAPSEAAAQQKPPRFDDYPAKEVYSGKVAEPLLTTARHRDYRTYIRAVADGGANFAGHYAVIILNCGEACVTADFLDVRTGKVIPRAFSNSGWGKHHDAFRKVEFRRDSRLIAFPGGINGRPPLGWHFYVFDDGRLRRLHTIVTRDFTKPLSEWIK